jgi:hypothetical protein
MLHKAMMAAAALAAMAVAAAVGVIALAFALYALLQPFIGSAGAAASVAAVSAIAVTLAGLFAARGAESQHKPSEPENFGLAERLLDLVRDKPMASAGVALAAGLMVMRNPAVIGVILRTLLEAWAGFEVTGKPKGRRPKA